MNLSRLVFYLINLSLLSSCVFKADEVRLKGINLADARGGRNVDEKHPIEVTNVILEGDQLKVTGNHLDKVTSINLAEHDLSIVSQSVNELILTSESLINLALNTAMGLVVANAYGYTTTTVVFQLVDGSVTATKLADDSVTTSKIVDGAVTSTKLSDMGAGIGQFLKYTGTGWAPGDLSSLTYAGNWNASTNSPDLSGGGNLGEFYIVSNAGSFNLAGGAGTNSWAVGDWAVWNNVVGQWEKIDNATNVQSFNGRSGPVVSATNDYTWAQIDKTSSQIGEIADVDLTTPATTGQVLKYDGTKWIASDDLSSGGAGSVSSSEIADGAIVNADISASAAIDQSKISGLTSLASSVSTNTSNISTNTSSIATNTSNIASNTSNISTNTSNIASNTSNISTNTSSISTNATAIGTKANSSLTLSAGDGLSGGGDLTTNRSFAVNVDNTTIEIVSDSLQVKAIPDTLITTSCADGEVLSASSGTYVCAASSTVGNWTLNSTDLYYSAGNVGIGVASPTSNLHVSKSLPEVADTVGVLLQTPATDGNASGTQYGLIVEHSGARYSPQVGIYTTINSSRGQFSNQYSLYKGDLELSNNAGKYGYGIDITVNTPSWNYGRRQAAVKGEFNAGLSSVAGDYGLSENTGAFGGHFKATGNIHVVGVYADAYLSSSPKAGSTAYPFVAASNGSFKMVVREDGNVGIGTTSPSSKLQVNGTVTATAFSGDGSALTNVSASSSAQVSASAGLVGTPSISFSGDTDTGFYQSTSGSDSIDIAVGGTQIFNLNSTSMVSPFNGGASISSATGTASAPTFSFAGDTDTGWYRPIADTMAAATAGSERMRISATGNVGIGTISPSTVLHVKPNDVTTDDVLYLVTNQNNADILMAQAGSIAAEGNLNINMDADNDETGKSIVFGMDAKGNSATELMRINDDGNVGIGTSSPTRSLHIGNGSESYVKFEGAQRSFLVGPGGEDYLRFVDETAGTVDRMIIDNSGRIGVGTTSPGSKFHLVSTYSGDTSADVILGGEGNYTYSLVEARMNSTLDDGDVPYFSMHREGDTAWQLGMLDDDFVIAKGGGAATSNLFPAKYFFIEATTGNVGIGTTAPDREFEVNGTVEAKDTNSTGSVDGAIRIKSNTSTGFFGGNYGTIQFVSNAGSASYGTIIVNQSNQMLLQTGGGNVGIGTSTPSYKLQVGNSADGSVAVANAWNTFSDERLKRDLASIDNAEEILEKINGYFYYWIDGEDDSRQLGVIAQEVREVLPEVVNEGEDGILTVDYSKLSALLIDIAKKQKLRIDSQEERIERLESENDLIKSYLCTIDPSAPFCLK